MWSSRAISPPLDRRSWSLTIFLALWLFDCVQRGISCHSSVKYFVDLTEEEDLNLEQQVNELLGFDKSLPFEKDVVVILPHGCHRSCCHFVFFRMWI